jgi:CRP-like cAMP-binding protein
LVIMLNELSSHISKKMGPTIRLTDVDLGMLAGFQTKPVFRPAGADIVVEGERNSHTYVLTSGWACSYKLLKDGGRQIIEFQIPGDFLGLQSVLLMNSSHNFQAVTPVRLIAIHVPSVVEAIARVPQLSEAILRVAAREEARVVEHLLDLGRRSAIVRMAHFLLELGTRLKMVGLATDDGFECPLNQYLLADSLGLTAVHVNRVLRQLRESKLLIFRDCYVRFVDRAAVVKLASFDEGYLDQRDSVLQ